MGLGVETRFCRGRYTPQSLRDDHSRRCGDGCQVVAKSRTAAGQLTLLSIQTHAVELHPWKADRSGRDTTAPPYNKYRVLSSKDTNPDFEDGLAAFVASAVANVPDVPGKWGKKLSTIAPTARMPQKRSSRLSVNCF
jgi:hypothetical protein